MHGSNHGNYTFLKGLGTWMIQADSRSKAAGYTLLCLISILCVHLRDLGDSEAAWVAIQIALLPMQLHNFLDPANVKT